MALSQHLFCLLMPGHSKDTPQDFKFISFELFNLFALLFVAVATIFLTSLFLTQHCSLNFGCLSFCHLLSNSLFSFMISLTYCMYSTIMLSFDSRFDFLATVRIFSFHCSQHFVSFISFIGSFTAFPIFSSFNLHSFNLKKFFIF